MASIASTASPNEQLFAAAEAGNVEAITNLCTQSGAEPYYQEEVHGESVLMRQQHTDNWLLSRYS